MPGPLSLAGASRSRALVAVRVNLAAAEKIGALSSAGSASATGTRSSRHEGMVSAIENMSSAIEANSACPKLYIERAGLLAMMDGGGTKKRGGDRSNESTEDYREAAASDFAMALWIDSQINARRRLGRGPAGDGKATSKQEGPLKTAELLTVDSV